LKYNLFSIPQIKNIIIYQPLVIREVIRIPKTTILNDHPKNRNHKDWKVETGVKTLDQKISG
jgi:hypothetical protein